jgi:hypothetical protein
VRRRASKCKRLYLCFGGRPLSLLYFANMENSTLTIVKKGMSFFSIAKVVINGGSIGSSFVVHYITPRLHRSTYGQRKGACNHIHFGCG